MSNTSNHEGVVTETVYTSISANRNENNISCHAQYILYSRTNCPILYDLKQSQVVAELIGHKAEVNGQCFINDIGKDTKHTLSTNFASIGESIHIISTSHDKTAIIWEVNTTKDSKLVNQRIIYHLKSPEDAVFTTRCSIKLNNSDFNKFLTVTTTIEGNVYLWHNDQLIQTVQAKNCCFDSKFFSIQVEGDDDLMFTFLFLAGGDNKVHIYQLIQQAETIRLKHVLDLTGYNDWVKCLDIIKLPGRSDEFLLASACQDCFIRVWDLKLIKGVLDKSLMRTSVSPALESPHHTDKTSFRLTATLETILSGHEGIVHGLNWFRRQETPILQLISCSEDKTIVIWRSKVAPLTGQTESTNKYESCPASGEIWKEVQRVGETGETNLPFLGVCLSEDEQTFYAQSLRGAIHSWTFTSDGIWEPSESITGHYEAITDLSWDKEGSYLLSASWDKTCRMHAIARADNKWHEIARPQVHGHEINCLASLDFYRFATGAEEKTIRTFGATKFFLKNFETLSKTNIPEIGMMSNENDHDMPVHAQLPALGLSNKGASCPYDVGGDVSKDKRDSSNNDWNEISNLVKQLAQLDHLSTLPFEEILLQSTLWWETSKLFGHSNELYALASDSSGAFLASASKANRSDLASIFIWETTKFRRVATIDHHSLTITRLKFSPDDKYLLSVSRDRTWCLSERKSALSTRDSQLAQPSPVVQQRQQATLLRNAYKKLVGTSKSNGLHERIIWDCCWTCDSKYFMTVSRDKRAILWSVDVLKRLINDSGANISATTSVETSCVASQMFDCSIQAVDSPSTATTDQSMYLFALGFEDGSLKLGCYDGPKTSSSQAGAWKMLASFENFHQLSIKRLAFQPPENLKHQDGQECRSSITVENSHSDCSGSSGQLLLASGGDDCIVKLTKINIARGVA